MPHERLSYDESAYVLRDAYLAAGVLSPSASDDAPAIVQSGRRPSRRLLVPRLRHEFEMWRRTGYVGGSDTTRTLLADWLEAAHEGAFRYHACRREAIETIIRPYEVARARCACRAATGGKTKVMSLAVVWSYYHALLEPHSLTPR